MIKEAASEDYQPIFANKGAGTSPEAQAKLASTHENGTHAAQEGSNGTAEAAPYSWTPEAQARLERAPVGFMRDCTKALIIKHADKLGTTHITLEVANEGIEQAKGYMEEAMKTGNLKDMIANLTGKASKQ
jgi:hypothetical protein